MDHEDIGKRLAAMVGRYVLLTVRNGRLFWSAPAGALSADDKCWLADRKETIVTLLNGPSEETRDQVWWDDDFDPDRSPVLWVPSRSECHAPKACSRLGPCRYRVEGMPCDQRVVKDEAA